MPTVESEIQLIEAISQSQVIAITLSHENLTDDNILAVINDYEKRLKLPTTDVLKQGCDKIIQSLCRYFPKLSQKIRRNHKNEDVAMPLLATR